MHRDVSQTGPLDSRLLFLDVSAKGSTRWGAIENIHLLVYNRLYLSRSVARGLDTLKTCMFPAIREVAKVVLARSLAAYRGHDGGLTADIVRILALFVYNGWRRPEGVFEEDDAQGHLPGDIWEHRRLHRVRERQEF